MKLIPIILFLLVQHQLVEKNNADKMIMKCYELGYKQGAQNVLVFGHYEPIQWKSDSLDMLLLLK